jgi:hypothetical protein
VSANKAPPPEFPGAGMMIPPHRYITVATRVLNDMNLDSGNGFVVDHPIAIDLNQIYAGE